MKILMLNYCFNNVWCVWLWSFKWDFPQFYWCFVVKYLRKFLVRPREFYKFHTIKSLIDALAMDFIDQVLNISLSHACTYQQIPCIHRSYLFGSSFTQKLWLFFTQWSKYIYNMCYMLYVCFFIHQISFTSVWLVVCMNSLFSHLSLACFFRFFHSFAIVFFSLFHFTFYNYKHEYTHADIERYLL